MIRVNAYNKRGGFKFYIDMAIMDIDENDKKKLKKKVLKAIREINRDLRKEGGEKIKIVKFDEVTIYL